MHTHLEAETHLSNGCQLIKRPALGARRAQHAQILKQQPRARQPAACRQQYEGGRVVSSWEVEDDNWLSSYRTGAGLCQISPTTQVAR